ncbi:related to aspartic proteinase OPSB [Cephalotrichum gorgonifer]|uniref:Probable aspartic-type endopeptidase OPSB n=1 Tax=Cephalotrichum gorgonifer TaxID=2041049 RepID=A0AAE8MZW5_9PEZI|nr:related to aspartic proteinase OPSB [Cephalotrichum gorgonifer]
MRSASLLLAALATGSLAASVGARLLQSRGVGPRVVRLDMHRDPTDPIRNHLLRKRKETVQASLDNLDTLYAINASVGTPSQNVRLHLDTGSSDLWVNTESSAFCSSEGNPCTVGGTYDPNSSSTASLINERFNISYVDGSGASGDYVSDTFRLGSTDIPNFQFGVGAESSTQRGILGIGYASNEAQVLRNNDAPYDNLPLKLVKGGHIRSAAYSIYLNDLDARTGTILFGGVDVAHYEGDLSALPIQSEGGVYRRFLVTLTSLKFGDETVDKDMALGVVLDSGSSITYLPADVVGALYEIVGATYVQDQDLAFVPCSARTDSRTLSFAFSGSAAIEVPMDELVLDLSSVTGRRAAFNNGQDACLFGIAPAPENITNVLGDTFMRSAYVVFDLENNEISLAQAKLNSTETDVREIGTGSDAVPGAKKVDNPVAAKFGLTEGGQSGAGPAASVSAAAAVACMAALLVMF